MTRPPNDRGQGRKPSYLIETLTDESGTDHAVRLQFGGGRFYTKWQRSAKRAERIAAMLKDDFGFEDVAGASGSNEQE